MPESIASFDDVKVLTDQGLELWDLGFAPAEIFKDIVFPPEN